MCLVFNTTLHNQLYCKINSSEHFTSCSGLVWMKFLEPYIHVVLHKHSESHHTSRLCLPCCLLTFVCSGTLLATTCPTHKPHGQGRSVIFCSPLCQQLKGVVILKKMQEKRVKDTDLLS